MTEGRRNGLRAVITILLALPAGSCDRVPPLDLATPPPNAIPDGVMATLGCDTNIYGSGLGVSGTGEGADGSSASRNLILDGYRPASFKDGRTLSVFWCALAPGKFVLAFVRDGRLTHPDCPATLTWHYVPKAPLSISDKPERLDDFRYVDNTARRTRAKPSGMTNGSIVIDGDDSLSNEFYCHKGAWVVRVQD